MNFFFEKIDLGFFFFTGSRIEISAYKYLSDDMKIFIILINLIQSKR